MSVFVTAVFDVLASDIVMSLVGVSVPFLAVGLVSQIFITKGRD